MPLAVLAQEADVWVFDGRTGRLVDEWGAKTFLLPHGLFVDHRERFAERSLRYQFAAR